MHDKAIILSLAFELYLQGFLEPVDRDEAMKTWRTDNSRPAFYKRATDMLTVLENAGITARVSSKPKLEAHIDTLRTVPAVKAFDLDEIP